MKTKRQLLVASLICAAISAACGVILFLSGCATASKPLDAAPIIAAQRQKDATVTAKADTIARANAQIVQAAPAVAAQTTVIAASVADIKGAVAAAPAAQVETLVSAQANASAAKDKTIAKQQATITAMTEDHALVTWLKVAAVLFDLAAVACGFFASYVEAIPVVGAFLGKIIGPVFSGLLGALSVTCYALARFITWTHVHPWAFGFLAFFGGGAVFIAVANHLWPAQVAAVETKLKAYITELEAKVGIKTAAPAAACAPAAPAAAPAPAAASPAASTPAA